jgi:hypothetical protein
VNTITIPVKLTLNELEAMASFLQRAEHADYLRIAKNPTAAYDMLLAGERVRYFLDKARQIQQTTFGTEDDSPFQSPSENP